MHAGLPCLIGYKIGMTKSGEEAEQRREGAFYAPLMPPESHIWFLHMDKNSPKIDQVFQPVILADSCYSLVLQVCVH